MKPGRGDRPQKSREVERLDQAIERYGEDAVCALLRIKAGTLKTIRHRNHLSEPERLRFDAAFPEGEAPARPMQLAALGENRIMGDLINLGLVRQLADLERQSGDNYRRIVTLLQAFIDVLVAMSATGNTKPRSRKRREAG